MVLTLQVVAPIAAWVMTRSWPYGASFLRSCELTLRSRLGCTSCSFARRCTVGVLYIFDCARHPCFWATFGTAPPFRTFTLKNAPLPGADRASRRPFWYQNSVRFFPE